MSCIRTTKLEAALSDNRKPLRRWRGWFAAAATAAIAVTATAAPARAAVPDRFGFVQWNGASTVASGTFPAATTVVMGAPGRYRIVFPGAGAPGGVVHVTAISQSPRWCQADRWGQSGADEIVYVSCYRPGGVLDPSGFSAVFARSSGPDPIGRYAYVDALGSGAIVTQHNSTGALNSVAHVGVGQYVVRLPGPGSAAPNEGNLQATAVNAAVGARCKVGRWASTPAQQNVLVLCWNAAGGLADNRFTLSYHAERSLYGGLIPPKFFGYLWNRPPLGPPPTNFNSAAGFGVNTLTPAGVGLSLVRFPWLTALPDTVSVTAYGVDPSFCGLLTAWAHFPTELVVRDVNCFTNAGAPIDAGFLISTASVS
jgi:hypothetical protein